MTRDKHGDQYDDDDPIIESQARPVGETSGGMSLRGHINDMPLALKRIGELEAKLAELEQESRIVGNACTAYIDATRVGHERVEALQARLAEAEAQRAVLVAALEDLITRADEADRLLPYGHGLRTLPARQALANQPHSDLVALVKAAKALREVMPIDGPRGREFADALEALLTNQPGFRVLIESEGA